MNRTELREFTTATLSEPFEFWLNEMKIRNADKNYAYETIVIFIAGALAEIVSDLGVEDGDAEISGELIEELMHVAREGKQP